MKQQVYEIAAQIVQQFPNGIRHKELLEQTHAKLSSTIPQLNRDSVASWITSLQEVKPQLVSKPSRGLYVPVSQEESKTDDLDKVDTDEIEFEESDFYEALALYLVEDLNECTKASPIGDMRANGKWGNPDVLGVSKPRAGDVFQYHWEVVTAELKSSVTAIATAFGQASSYRLFSHRVYVAVPRLSPQKELEKLLAQCHHLGLGVLTFDLNKERPNFDQKLRARTSMPDMFYVNEMAERIKGYDSDIFDQLFN